MQKPFKQKLALLLVIVVGVMILGGVSLILGIQSFARQYGFLIEDRTTKIILAQDVARCIQDFLLTWQDYQLTGDPYDYDRLRELATRIDSELEDVRPLVRTPTGRERLKRLGDVWKSCRKAVLMGARDLSDGQMEEVLLGYARDASRAADDFLAWQQRQFLRGNEELKKQVNQAVRWVAIVVFAGVGTVLLLGAFTARSVSGQALVTEMVLSTTRDAVITVDRKGRITAANQAFEQLLGKPVSSLLHRPYSEVCGEVYPLVEVIKSGEVRQEEITCRTAQGEWYLIADAVPWRDQRQRIIGGMLVLKDITGRKVAEDKVRAHANYLSVLNQTAAAILDLSVSHPDYTCSVAEVLLEGICGITGADKACYFSYDQQKDAFIMETAVGVPPDEEGKIEISSEEGNALGAIGSSLKPLYLPDVTNDSRWISLAPGVVSAYFVPVHYMSRLYGVLGVFAGERDAFGEEQRQLVDTFAVYAAAALDNARLYQELKAMTFGVITALSNAVDARDSHTGGHGHRLVELALALARELGCSEQECEDIRWAAVLHDVGKIGIPDRILCKAGPLDPEEWKVMHCHPEIGEQILAPIPALKNAARIVRHHHERYDGGGYPDGLKGEEIPLGARIIAVADAYVAMTEDRIYRKGRSHQEALVELQRCSGTQFDPKVVEAFVRLFSDQTKAFA